MHTSRSIANLSQKVCCDVDNKVTFFDQTKCSAKKKNLELHNNQHPFELVFSAFQYRILDASQVCKEMGAEDLKFETKTFMEAILFAAISRGIRKILAEINYDLANNVFRFVSDDVNVRYGLLFKFRE